MSMPHEIQDILKRKSQNFRSHSLSRAKKAGHDVKKIPMPKELVEWIARQPIIEKRKRIYFSCYLTQELIPIAKIELDHRVPISRGGDYSADNLGITSKRMNAAKGNRTEQEFKSLLELIAGFDEVARKSIIADLYAGTNRFSFR